MEQNIEFEDEEDIIYEVSLGLNSHNNGSQSSDVFEIDSVISHESSADGLAYHDDNSELSNESPHPTPPDYFQQWIGYILSLRDSPKQLADLNGAKTSSVLGELVRFINLPNVMQLLFQYGLTVYNNEMHGIFIQEAAKEFKQSYGFDEANFPFEDQGGPQKGKLQQYGYVYKYWTGKADKSYKMRKFYQEKGVAIFAVFQEATSPSASPSSSTEIKVDKENTNKKPRVGDSPFPSSEASSHSSSPTRPTNAQPSSTGSNYNYSSTGSAPTNYSQQPTPQNGTTNNTNAAPNPLHTTEHIVNRLDALDGRVDGLTTRMTNLELTNGTARTVTITPLQRQLGILTLQVLRENGGRHQMGKPLATKVRKLFGGSLETKVVNNLLYTVLEPLGIVRLQDKEWVLIDEEKAKQFEQQQ